MQIQPTLQIPTFRRVSSFVGRDEGFELFAPSSFTEALPSPKVLKGLVYTFPTGDCPIKYTSGPLNFDCAEVGNGDLLGAIPSQPELLFKMAAAEAAEEPDDNEVSCGIYTRAERRRKIERYRNKKQHRFWGKRVMYKCRQNFAKNRRRVAGRFVKLNNENEEPKKNRKRGRRTHTLQQRKKRVVAGAEPSIAGVAADMPSLEENSDDSSPPLSPISDVDMDLTPLCLSEDSSDVHLKVEQLEQTNLDSVLSKPERLIFDL